MTPYRTPGAIVIIDPNIKPKDLLFGSVPQELYKLSGTVQEKKYLHAKKCMIYKVEFEGNPVLTRDGEIDETGIWFKESELVVVIS
jgi:hypothetical protein